MQIRVSASTNQLVLLQASSSLSVPQWVTIYSSTLAAGQLTISDPGANNFPNRFYRAISSY